MNVTKHWFWAIAIAALASSAPGCVGADTLGATSDLTEVDPNTPPLETAERDDWVSAPAGCEDRLGRSVRFKVASSRDGLIAAVDADGHVVCVDSLESVQEELEEEGRDEEAEELAARFLVTLTLPDPQDFWDDPTPQPSTQIDAEDPSPQKGGMAAGDPSPQPS